VKGLVLFLILNILFAAWNTASIGKLSFYNILFPGRTRLPFGENPTQSYNLSLFNLNAMLSSHEIADGAKPEDEFRVVLIGDSSVWGTLLKPEETLSGQLNAMGLTCDDRNIKVYNLGYPTISLTKDVMLLDLAMKYQPDLIIWPMTLESFPYDKQLSSPLVANNAAAVRDLIQKYDLPLDSKDPLLVTPTFWERTLVGQRRNLADILRLQLYGVMWAATGIDQVYTKYEAAQTDFENDVTFHDFTPEAFNENGLAFPMIDAGIRAAGDTPLLIVNEPILISSGINSDLRYNFFYPRWAYDQYRVMMQERSQSEGWNYIDLWDLVSPDEFTNSAIHLTPIGETQFAAVVGQTILERFCSHP
jgi:hypothetical protein